MEDREFQPIHKRKVILDQSIDLVCSNCGSDIDNHNVNINNSLAKCSNCGSVFNIKGDSFFTDNRPGRPEMIMPAGTDILPLSDTLDIRVDWFKSNPKGSLGFLTFFTIFWNGILAVIAAGMLASGALTSIAFLSIHLLVGLGLIYYILRLYMNYTDIIVTSSSITISQRPIPNPFSPNKTLNSSDIDQIYVSKYVASTTNNQPNYAYALYAVMKQNDRRVTLIKGMNKETQLYLEQEIERYLNIKDRDVANAIKQ